MAECTVTASGPSDVSRVEEHRGTDEPELRFRKSRKPHLTNSCLNVAKGGSFSFQALIQKLQQEITVLRAGNAEKNS